MCAFNPKHLLALPGVVHIRIEFAVRVPGRRRRMRDGRVHDRARLDTDSLSHPDGRSPHSALDRQGLASPEQRRRLAQRLLHTGVRQVEPPSVRTRNPRESVPGNTAYSAAKLRECRGGGEPPLLVIRQIPCRAKRDPKRLLDKLALCHNTSQNRQM